MKRKIIIFVLVFVLFSVFPLYAATFNGKKIVKGIWKGNEVEYVEGEILFKINAKAKLSDLEKLLEKNQARLLQGLDQIGMGRTEIPSSLDIFQVIQNLNSSDLIEFAEPNMVDYPLHSPDDYYFIYGHQWGLWNYGQAPPGGTPGADIKATSAWDISVGSSQVLVSVLDSGIPMLMNFLYHSDLSDTSRYILGEDFTGDGGWVKDRYGHGTHVTGILGAMTNNETGVAGVDWRCRILINQVFDSSGVGTHNTFKYGVLHAVDYGVRVINYSGGGYPSSTKEQAVRYADSNNVLLVSPAGNGYGDSVIYPAHYADTYQNVMAVSATTSRDRLAYSSNYGPSICVAAPGGYGIPWDEDDIFSTMPNYHVKLNDTPYNVSTNYGYIGGTSMSCAMVSGLAALLLSIKPNFNAYELREIIEQSADKVGEYIYYIETQKSYELGHGRINCFSALALASGYTYVYGDANGDGVPNAADIVYLINYLFGGGPRPDPPSAGDPNGDCKISTADIVYLINYLYLEGPILLRGCVEE
ncbi:MAG: S8 family serine peptidase [candidate division Zixibacteria bacterium]|nr:S8 family serine peptidase [candidate division Zixibacteria bacterium]